MRPSGYYDKRNIESRVKAGRHRDAIGGLWDEIGQLQLDFLISQGLLPHHKLLDVGCGSLRAGVKLVRYLDAEHYFGTDLNESLITAGYDIELSNEGLGHKLPRTNLVADGDFNFSWCPVKFDYVMAQSLFTHLPLNFLRACLERLPDCVVPGGKFFATIFEIADDHSSYQPYRHEQGGVITYGTQDPYHYRFADMEFCCRGLPWEAAYIGKWKHPRAQRMIQFKRTMLALRA